MPIPSIQNVPTNMNVVFGITNYEITYSLLVHNVRKITNWIYLVLFLSVMQLLDQGGKKMPDGFVNTIPIELKLLQPT